MNKKVFILQLLLLGITARTALAQETIDPEDAVTTQHQAVFNGLYPIPQLSAISRYGIKTGILLPDSTTPIMKRMV